MAMCGHCGSHHTIWCPLWPHCFPLNPPYGVGPMKEAATIMKARNALLQGREDIRVLRLVDNFGVGPDGLLPELKSAYELLQIKGCIERVYQLTAKGNAILAQYEQEKDREEDKEGVYR